MEAAETEGFVCDNCLSGIFRQWRRSRSVREMRLMERRDLLKMAGTGMAASIVPGAESAYGVQDAGSGTTAVGNRLA